VVPAWVSFKAKEGVHAAHSANGMRITTTTMTSSIVSGAEIPLRKPKKLRTAGKHGSLEDTHSV